MVRALRSPPAAPRLFPAIFPLRSPALGTLLVLVQDDRGNLPLVHKTLFEDPRFVRDTLPHLAGLSWARRRRRRSWIMLTGWAAFSPIALFSPRRRLCAPWSDGV